MAETGPTVDTSADSSYSSVVVATIDPSIGGASVANSSGYIKAIVLFTVMADGNDSDSAPDVIHVTDDKDGDVISVVTDQGSSKQEGDATSKLTVVLNNNNQKYAGRLIPQQTLVKSWIQVERNEVMGRQLKVIQETFPLFFGRVQEVNMDDQTCTVDCGDEGSTLEGSVEFDITWMADKTAKERVQDIVDALGIKSPLVIEQFLSKQTRELLMEGYSSSTQSGASGISAGVLKPMALDWTIPSDQDSRLVIMDGTYQVGNGTMNLTDFVLTPQDNESIVGYCNVVTVTGDSTKPETGPDKNTNTSDSSLTTPEEATDIDGIQKYGRIEAPNRSCPWLSQAQANQFAQNLLEVYKSYENRLVSPTIVSKIPMLNSRINYIMTGYNYPDNFKGSDNWNNSGLSDSTPRSLDLKVLRKRVQYDSGGVLSQLECKRYYAEETAGTKVPDNIQKKAEHFSNREYEYFLYAFNKDTGHISVYRNASQADYESFMEDGTWPNDPSKWDEDYTGPTPFGESDNGQLV